MTGRTELGPVAPSLDSDEFFVEFYRREQCIGFPFIGDERQIAYVQVHELDGLGAGHIHIETSDALWRPPAQVRPYIQAAAERRASGRAPGLLYNGRVARCAGITHGKVATIHVQVLHYFDYLGTNLNLDVAVNGLSLRQRLHADGRLPPLADNALGNSIGVNVLIANANWDIPLQIRSPQVAIRPGQLCSSASGGLALGDIGPGGTSLAHCDLMREVREELGDELASRLGPPVFLGALRELARGGQLELFVFAQGDFSLSEAARSAALGTRFDHEASALHVLHLPCAREGRFDARDIAGAISELELAFPGRIASPLRANITLLTHHLDRMGRLHHGDQHKSA